MHGEQVTDEVQLAFWGRGLERAEADAGRPVKGLLQWPRWGWPGCGAGQRAPRQGRDLPGRVDGRHALITPRPLRPLIPHILKLTALTKVIWTPASVSMLLSPLTWHQALKALSHQRNLAIPSCPPSPAPPLRPPLKDSPKIRLKVLTGKALAVSTCKLNFL